MDNAGSSAHLPDDALIDLVRRGDKQAFVAIFDRYKDRIFRYLSGYLGDHEKARSVTLDAMMSAYRCIGDYRERGRFSSWLYAIAINLAKKELRRTKSRKEVSIDTPMDAEGLVVLGDLLTDERDRPDYRIIVEDRKEFIYKLIGKLDEIYREPLLLYDMEGFSYEEIARILKCHPITVGTRIRRARKMFYELAIRYKSEL